MLVLPTSLSCHFRRYSVWPYLAMALENHDHLIELPEDTPCIGDVYETIIANERFLQALDFKVYPLEELVAATDNFHPSKLLGEGSNGQVFGGVLKDGTHIAVKRLPERASAGRIIQEEEDFVNEIRRIGSVNHRNIMQLLGFCLEGQSPLLVSRKLYSLYTVLYEDGTLDWDATYKVAVDVAKGLSYLHNGARLQMVHCDIKPGNILLDPHTLQAYISDFGVVHLGRGHQSKEGCEEIEVNWYYGSPGYMAPEVRGRKRLSAKSDVYSFGKLLYALISGEKDVQRMPAVLVRKNVGSTKGFTNCIFKTKIWLMRLFPCVRAFLQRSVLNVLDERLKKDVRNSGRKLIQMAAMIRLITVCTQEDPARRPSMERAAVELESANVRHIPWSIKMGAKFGLRGYPLWASVSSFVMFMFMFLAVVFSIGYLIPIAVNWAVSVIIFGIVFAYGPLAKALYGNASEDIIFD